MAVFTVLTDSIERAKTLQGQLQDSGVFAGRSSAGLSIVCSPEAVAIASQVVGEAGLELTPGFAGPEVAIFLDNPTGQDSADAVRRNAAALLREHVS